MERKNDTKDLGRTSVATTRTDYSLKVESIISVPYYVAVVLYSSLLIAMYSLEQNVVAILHNCTHIN